MTIATLFLALIATPAADRPGEPLLLDFHAEWCGPCKTMRPEVEKLVRRGYPVKSVDIDHAPELAARYQVDKVPTFVVVDGAGKELARNSGAIPAVQLATFYNEAKLKAGAGSRAMVASDEPEPTPAVEVVEQDVPTESEDPAARSLVNPKPWETVVRIKMHLSDREWGLGSGTIIHSTPDEAIILTCAHIFRVKGRKQPTPDKFDVKIAVDLFDGQLHGQTVHPIERDLRGEAIDYNFTTDVGLIRIRPGRRLASSRVVPPNWQPKRGFKMYSVGCSHGEDATTWDTQILDPRVSMSNGETRQPFTTMKCQFQPKEGRSGGGLYTSDGYVAGVCDFADPNEHVGLYATPESIHAILDRNKLMALYRPTTDQPDRLLASNKGRRSPSSSGTIARAQSPSEPEAGRPGPITLPPPALAGVKMPKAEAGGWTPRPSAPKANLARTTRPFDSTTRAIEDESDVPANTAIPTDQPIEPSSEEKAIEDLAEAPRSKRLAPAPARPSGSGNWTRSTRPLPDFSDQPSSRP